jgi:hypothetical protein
MKPHDCFTEGLPPSLRPGFALTEGNLGSASLRVKPGLGQTFRLLHKLSLEKRRFGTPTDAAKAWSDEATVRQTKITYWERGLV